MLVSEITYMLLIITIVSDHQPHCGRSGRIDPFGQLDKSVPCIDGLCRFKLDLWEYNQCSNLSKAVSITWHWFASEFLLMRTGYLVDWIFRVCGKLGSSPLKLEKLERLNYWRSRIWNVSSWAALDRPGQGRSFSLYYYSDSNPITVLRLDSIFSIIALQVLFGEQIAVCIGHQIIRKETGRNPIANLNIKQQGMHTSTTVCIFPSIFMISARTVSIWSLHKNTYESLCIERWDRELYYNTCKNCNFDKCWQFTQTAIFHQWSKEQKNMWKNYYWCYNMSKNLLEKARSNRNKRNIL